ncbi:hypothetical protein HN992_02180 [Candidatus Woesearchaeota archaeon]|jgi:hypothetical protein|nr:hypothetical protein [Candidatus Woesearchaeota archaeon]MBT3439041.1 hypothetical protein [Candidatus Woesearchaeota archaeon]MBT4058027.1 hypothetical protein [Candidatus Woesearchaeota archaeon]MBT4207110.1 hypothetical protein [Candidatus Woesearchaeota archaeon]MBT4731328.1 hypothetical protein [Candidatus Woesearchaeota archaeon]
MVTLNESTKKILLFLALALCLYFLVLSFTAFFGDESEEEFNLTLDENGLDDLIENVEEGLEGDFLILEKIVELNGAKIDYIQKGSMKISLDRIYIDEEDDTLYFDVIGEDMFLNEEDSKELGNFFFRSPFSWTAHLQYFRGDSHQLLICDYSADGRFWNTTYCINLDELEDNYFGQIIRFVYTDNSAADIAELTPITLMKQRRTFVYEISIPQDFYNN